MPTADGGSPKTGTGATFARHGREFLALTSLQGGRLEKETLISRSGENYSIVKDHLGKP
jgi:hypothetical protein